MSGITRSYFFSKPRWKIPSEVRRKYQKSHFIFVVKKNIRYVQYPQRENDSPFSPLPPFYMALYVSSVYFHFLKIKKIIGSEVIGKGARPLHMFYLIS